MEDDKSSDKKGGTEKKTDKERKTEEKHSSKNVSQQAGEQLAKSDQRAKRSNNPDAEATAYDILKERITELQVLKSHLQKIRKNRDQAEKTLKKYEAILKNFETTAIVVANVLGNAKDGNYIIKLTSGPRLIVKAADNVKKERLIHGCRVGVDRYTLMIVTCLPPHVELNVLKMVYSPSEAVSFNMIGGLSDQIRSIREVIELPLTKPGMFKRVGIKPPKGILLYGPPGTGKTMLAKAAASQLGCSFIQVCSSGVVDKYIGESGRLIREMFAYAKGHRPCVLFFDEIDAIGSDEFIGAKRGLNPGSADREIQRCLLELLHQMDGFDAVEQVTVMMATNRPDILDSALLRPGRIDRKLEVPLPNVMGRFEILKIYAKQMQQHSRLDLFRIAQMTAGLNGADLRGICTEAGYLAIRNKKDTVTQDDMMKATRKVMETKALENKMEQKHP